MIIILMKTVESMNMQSLFLKKYISTYFKCNYKIFHSLAIILEEFLTVFSSDQNQRHTHRRVLIKTVP